MLCTERNLIYPADFSYEDNTPFSQKYKAITAKHRKPEPRLFRPHAIYNTVHRSFHGVRHRYRPSLPWPAVGDQGGVEAVEGIMAAEAGGDAGRGELAGVTDDSLRSFLAFSRCIKGRS